MLQRKNDTFLAECRTFCFAGSCEQCVHHDADRRACSFFWPDGDHRDARVSDPAVEEISFCKDFELN